MKPGNPRIFWTGVGVVFIGMLIMTVAPPASTTCVPQYGVFSPDGTLQGTGTDYSALYSEFVASGNYPGWYVQQIGQSCYYSTSSGTTSTTSVPAAAGPFYVTLQDGTREMTGVLPESTASTIEANTNPFLLLPTGATSSDPVSNVTDTYGNYLKFSPLTSGNTVYVELTQYQYLPVVTQTATETLTATQTITSSGTVTTTSKTTIITTETTTQTLASTSTTTSVVTQTQAGTTVVITQTQTILEPAAPQGTSSLALMGILVLGFGMLLAAFGFFLHRRRRSG